jgi:hypothetical protein
VGLTGVGFRCSELEEQQNRTVRVWQQGG